MTPLMPSPGMPKITSTPHDTKVSTSASDALLDITFPRSIQFHHAGWRGQA
jgi:hypothetical protein